MSRGRLRAALTSRAPIDGASLPLIGMHAGRLEQVSEILFLTDPESQARALRNAQALYGTDAVTVGAGLDTLAIAARMAAGSQADPLAARKAAADADPVADLPDPGIVVGQAVMETEFATIRRLRPVLGERAGIAVAMPAPDRLAAQLGGDAGAEWCLSLLQQAVRRYGALEPDALLTVGETDTKARLGPICGHFGVVLIHLGAEPPRGVVAVPGGEFVNGRAGGAAGGGGAPGWLYTTTSEIPAEADPAAVKEAIARLRGDRQQEGCPER